MLRLFNETKESKRYITRSLNYPEVRGPLKCNTPSQNHCHDKLLRLKDLYHRSCKTNLNRSNKMEQCSSNTADPAPVVLGFDVFDRVLTRYMDNPQDILNFCLANKEYYGHYIGTLYRHNVRYDGSSALEWVAERGFLSVVSSILDVPLVDVFAPKDIWGKVLSIAQKQNNMRLAELLFERQHVQDFIQIAAAIKAGKSVNLSQEIITTLDDEDFMELDEESLLEPMFEAAKKDQRRLVELYLSHVSVDLQNADGLTALHCAAGKGGYDLAKLLLEVHGANTEIRRNPRGFRPIEVAARDGQLRLVELLLSKGAEPRSDGAFTWPLTLAAVHSHEGIVRLLLQNPRIDPRARDGNGESCLELATLFGNTGVVNILLEDGRADPNERNGMDETPLGLAAHRCNQEIVRLFLDDDRVDPNGQHINSMTPLLVASSSFGMKSVHVIKMLLEDSRVDVQAQDDDGCTACVLAAKHGIIRNVKALLRNPHIDPNQGDNNQKTPAMYAAAGYIEQAEATPNYLKRNKHLVLRALILDERVDLNKVDDSGQTAMHWALRRFRRENVQLLANSGRVNLNQDCGPGRRTPMEACILKHNSCTQLLLDSGYLDLSETSSQGETPLMFAVRKAGRNNCDIERSVWLILEKQRCGRLDLRYDNGLTLLEQTVQAGSQRIVCMLLFTGKGTMTPRAKELCSDEVIREMLDHHRGKPSRWWTSRTVWKCLGLWKPVLFVNLR
ncbi:ANK_REP_REGION domain-containing protein [Trichoderma simmonsii]|uniref:ANK_REP_REGION domain-containing protein n=1 Tax=Trichoderma simmonsii TaxID=1491479 RepID=A0A8G0L4T4_9HYPO|nr:ANK_REP_REGION domain-containing protein [Trichoderma simmonsii]